MIKKLDHLVITTKNADNCLKFYHALGFKSSDNGSRIELFAGDFKINVHFFGRELSPHADNIMPGSADLCFEIDSDIYEFEAQLEAANLPIEVGVVDRNGVNGPMKSIYLRDPDGNLVEFCSYHI